MLREFYVRPISKDDSPDIRDGRKRLYFFGYVKFEDTDGRPITTAFCRVLNPPPRNLPGAAAQIGHFVPLIDPNPDYEYED
jgi:hypothetical protein